MSAFQLDERLARDSDGIVGLGLCQLRLMKDSRWPWLILVPEREGLSEVFDLPPLEQTMMALEVNMVAAALKKVTGAEKINIGALGNIVRQLHIHVVARSQGDANWPGPVWGHGQSVGYGDHARHVFVRKILEALSS
nr:HIT family protein [uncultured Gellertiella sp.]